MAALIDLLIIMLVIMPALPGMLVAVLIYHRVWDLPSPSLHERALLAFRDWLVASLAAAMAMNRLLGWGMPNMLVLLLLAVALLLVSLPSAWWLILYSRGWFR